MTRGQNTRLLNEAGYLLLGVIALAVVTGLFLWLDVPLVTVAFTFLIVIVLLSLVISFPSLVALSIIAVGCLDYFFTVPFFSFTLDYRQDIIATATFLITSLIVTGLVRRLRAEQHEHMLASERLRDAQIGLAHLDRVAAIGQLAASIAHEVNQPIATARNNAAIGLRFLSRNPPDLEEVREALGCVVKDTDRAGEVIGRIRALIKKAPPRKEGVAINDAILEVVALTHGEAMKNGVSVRTQLAEDLPPIEGDRVQLQQVILNLMINAVETMSGVNEAPRELLLSTEKTEADVVHVAVQDTGPGLAPAVLERLFDAFFTTKPSGLGLGLSICRSIIEAHDGRLWAVANTPRGAIFQFTLPARPVGQSLADLCQPAHTG